VRLARVLQDRGEIDEAVAALGRALEHDPSCYETLRRLSGALTLLGRLDEAIAACDRAIALRPDSPDAASDRLFLLQYHPAYDGRAICEEAVRWRRRHAEPLTESLAAHPNDRAVDRRLRIGYVSADFGNHVSSLFTIPLLTHHSHEQFEIFCYSDVKKVDHVTDVIRGCADHWREIVNVSEADVAQIIRRDGVDILVDLSMHIAESKPLIFARKPAPVQMCWLAYPGTTGLTTMDYRVSDPHLDPEGGDDGVYVEKTLRLPDCFWCYDPRLEDLEVAGLPARVAGFVTFGSLNAFCKVNPPVIDLWARVLRAVDKSRLLLFVPPGQSRHSVSEQLGRQGIARDRFEFVYSLPRREYFKLYDRVDIGLDTFPCNGHTTSLDSYFMGVPVVTLAGATVAGRAGKSFAMNLGLPELVASTPAEYVAAAVSVASDTARLAACRAGMRSRMRQSPLMDGARFARNFEAIFRNAWRKYCSFGA
jgi:predicted O-linked N-acetylglucosamine transferase (SPINDLY family)